MDEANRKDCSRCRERRSTSKINVTKGLDLYRITLGLLLLLLLLTMTLAMLGLTQMRAKDGTVLKRTLSNVVGDLGISRQEVNTLDKVGEMHGNIDAVHSSGTAEQATEQLMHRRKRRTSNEDADTSRKNDSDTDDSRPIHSESQPTTNTDSLADFKQRIHRATSFDEIRVILQSSTVLKDVFPSPSHTTTTGASDLRRRLLQCRRRFRSSVGAKSCVRKSNRSTQPGLQELLKVLQTNKTCNRIPATIVSEFGLGRDQSKSIQLPVCSPKETLLTTSQSEASSEEKNKAHLDPEWMNILEKAAAIHGDWMDDIIENGLCSPVKMIINLAPPEGVAMGNDDNDYDDGNDDEHSDYTKSNDPVKALIYVKKCGLLYEGRNSDQNVTCVAVKKKSRLIPIQNKDVIKSYIVTDHLKCIATTNRLAIVRKVETTTYKPTTKDNNKNKSNRSCPWPFQKVNQTRCTCKKINEGSPGYLRYLMCRNIQKGIWKLQERQAQCVRRRHCLKPICDEKKFNIRTGQCYRPPKRKPNANRRNNRRKPKT